MAVSWYVVYSLSYRDIEELLADRGLNIDHSTANRWVIEYSSQLLEKLKKKRKRLNKSWRMDETYVKVKDKWMYQYRAVDKNGDTIDCYFSSKRDKKLAKKFFVKSLKYTKKPMKINIDKRGSNLNMIIMQLVRALLKNEK